MAFFRAKGLTKALLTALRERVAGRRIRKPGQRLSEELRAIGERVAALPVLDDRTPEEIVGYDERGLPR
jgi:antitoxin VapB